MKEVQLRANEFYITNGLIQYEASQARSRRAAATRQGKHNVDALAFSPPRPTAGTPPTVPPSASSFEPRFPNFREEQLILNGVRERFQLHIHTLSVQ
jgi:hypothetical protein